MQYSVHTWHSPFDFHEGHKLLHLNHTSINYNLIIYNWKEEIIDLGTFDLCVLGMFLILCLPCPGNGSAEEKTKRVPIEQIRYANLLDEFANFR